jgi:hypothetical protein
VTAPTLGQRAIQEAVAAQVEKMRDAQRATVPAPSWAGIRCRYCGDLLQRGRCPAERATKANGFLGCERPL